MHNKHFVQVLEAKEWAKHAGEFTKETALVRELRIQAKKFERLLFKSLRDFLSHRNDPPSKSRRKKEGRLNREIDQQHQHVLALADQAMREEFQNSNGSPMEKETARKSAAELQELVSIVAASKFEKLVLKTKALKKKKRKKKK